MSAPTLTNVQLHDPSGNAKTAFLTGDPMVLEFDYSDADTVQPSSSSVEVDVYATVTGKSFSIGTLTVDVPTAGYDLAFVDSIEDPNTTWSKVSDAGGHLIWHAVAGAAVAGLATAHVVDAEGNVGSASIAYSIAAPPPPPPPPTTGTHFGASVNDKGDAARLAAMGLKLRSARLFNLGAAPAKWSDSDTLMSLPAGCDVVVSVKSGTPAAFRAFLESRPSTVGRVYGCYWHEPEDNFVTAAQQAAYRSTWAQFGPAIRAAGCISTLILMQWSLKAASKRNWKDWYPAGQVDAVFWDAYNAGNKANPATYNDPAQMYSICKQASASVGARFGITETGSPIVAGSTSAQRAAWVRKLAIEAAAEGAEQADWWDDGSAGGFNNVLDAAAAAAWGSQQ